MALSAGAVEIDGVVSEGEWTQAAIYQGMRSSSNREGFPVAVTTYVWADGDFTYVAVQSAVPAVGLQRRVMPKRRGALARIDDSVTLKLADGRQLAVNANGAVSGEAEGLVVASTVTNGTWTCECKLPKSVGELVDVGRHWPLADAPYGCDASLHVGSGLVPTAEEPRLQVLKVTGGASAYRVQFRVVNPGKRAVVLKVAANGSPEHSQPAVLQKQVTVGAGASSDFELKGAILGDELVKLNIGFRKYGTKSGFARALAIRPNYEGSPFVRQGNAAELVSYKFAYYPSYNRFRVKTDVSLIPGFAQTVRGIHCVATDGAGQPVFERTLQPDAKGVADETFAVPDLRPLTVKSGNAEYRLRITVEGEGLADAKYEKRFYRHAMDWENNRVGLSETVVPPFTAMSVTSAPRQPPKVRTVLREHELSSLGLFRQVKAPAKEGETEPVKPILAEPGMQLLATVGGETFPIEGQVKLASSNSPVVRTFDGAFDTRGIAGKVHGVFEYDGQLAWTLTLERGQLDALKLVVPFADGAATHVHACVDNLRNNLGARIPAGTGRVWSSAQQGGRDGLLGDYLPYIWLGGTLRGLAVYGENDRGWVHYDGWPMELKKTPVPCYEMLRTAEGRVSLVLNLVQRPVTISEPRQIKLNFLATPVKPMLENWRANPTGFLYGSGWMWGAGPKDADVEPFDGTDEFFKVLAQARDTGRYDRAYLENVMQRVPLSPEPGGKPNAKHANTLRVHYESGLNNAVRHRRDCKFIWYTNARGLDFGIPSGRTYCDEWSRYEFVEMDRDFNRFSSRDYTLDPNRAFQDYAVWWYRKMIRSTACDALYWDDIYLSPNYDYVGNDTFQLPDGRVQPATGVNNMRALVKRCATMQAEDGYPAVNNWIHMTDTALAPISAFAGVHYDMEDWPQGGKAFQEKYPMGYLEAVSIGRQMGCRVEVMAHYPNISKEKSAWYERTGAGMMLCYEFYWKYSAYVFNRVHDRLKAWGYRTPAVRVWNYWNGDEPYPLAVGNDRVASIAMAKSAANEAIFVLSDFSGQGGKVRVKVNAEMLNLKRGYRALDFEAEGESALPQANDEIEVELQPFDFRVVILK